MTRCFQSTLETRRSRWRAACWTNGSTLCPQSHFYVGTPKIRNRERTPETRKQVFSEYFGDSTLALEGGLEAEANTPLDPQVRPPPALLPPEEETDKPVKVRAFASS